MDDSLESLLGKSELSLAEYCRGGEIALNSLPSVSSLSIVCVEKATNPKNKYEDWEFIMAFCDRVNTEMEG